MTTIFNANGQRQLAFGVDYYPEQWPSERWEADAERMRAAGFNVVRLAEFAWSRIEPSDGVFEFDWLDEAIKVLTRHGMKIVLGTPSASVPPWLFETYPDMAIVDEDGMKRTYGSRRDASPTHPQYCAYAVRIAREMALRYSSHPAVIGWQIDNEFGDRCYSPITRQAFQQWLRAKYKTLDALNNVWGTAFWSHTYTAWEQIPVPLTTTHALHNPGLHLDYLRFMTDAYVSFQQAQIDTLRAIVPAHHLITHNLMGFTYSLLDYGKLAHTLDFVSWDNYPHAFWRTPTTAVPSGVAMGHSAMWGLKCRSFWVMEQQSGPSGWKVVSPAPQPGQLALWTYQAIAHGADGVLYFRWRTNPRAAEQLWHGILDYDDVPRRRYREVQQVGAALARIGAYIAGSEVHHRAALLQDYDTRFSFQIQPDNAGFRYEAHLHDYYGALHRRGISAAVITREADLARYPLLIAPALRLVDEVLADQLTQYVMGGGVLILTMRSGSRDANNAHVETTLPGRLADLCGVSVEEYDSLPVGVTRAVRFQNEVQAQATVWCDVLGLTTATALAVYDECYYTAQPVVTLNRVGAGSVIYVGTAGDESLIETVLAYALTLAGVTAPLELPSSGAVEITERWQGSTRLLFVLNHSAQPATVRLDFDACDLLTGMHHRDEVTLQAYQVCIFIYQQDI